MNEYRVTKYDPSFRVNDRYISDEWTSIADVGRSFDGQNFCMEDYEQAEKRHIDFLCELADMCGAFSLRVNALETHCSVSYQEEQTISRKELSAIIRANLREQCWCRLVGESFFIHFGYDYYMYVGCDLLFEDIAPLANKYELFCERFISPYHDEEENI